MHANPGKGNLEDFFKHENQPWPPALSKGGTLRSGNKADLLVELRIFGATSGRKPTSYCKDTGWSCNSPNVVSKKLSNRIDIVWDVYTQGSMKAATRESRGKGIGRRVERSSKMPSNWKSFIRVNDSKTELFHLLAEEAPGRDLPQKQVFSTYGDKVLSAPRRGDKVQIEPCSHEEADSRLVLHLLDAAHAGHENIMNRTCDADVVVIILSKLASIPLAREVWISFGVGKHHRYIAGPTKAPALTVFHAFTGSDTTSFFAGIGKRTAWKTWDVLSGCH